MQEPEPFATKQGMPFIDWNARTIWVQGELRGLDEFIESCKPPIDS
jgi:hypothetical protein